MLEKQKIIDKICSIPSIRNCDISEHGFEAIADCIIGILVNQDFLSYERGYTNGFKQAETWIKENKKLREKLDKLEYVSEVNSFCN